MTDRTTARSAARFTARTLLPLSIPVLVAAAGASAQLVRSAAGVSADVLVAVNQFRADLGALNPNTPGSLGTGRREINWDGVPNNLASPNAFPGDFFNANLAGRARGAVFSTPGSHMEVSANAANPPIAFGNIEPSYATSFAAFSPQRLFTSVDSNITDARLFVPGSDTPALSRGFGVVFCDVDNPGSASIEFFDRWDRSLGKFVAPAAFPSHQTFSFLGVSFENAIVSWVRITSGTQGPGVGIIDNPTRNEDIVDVVVMDDFIYGEPVAAPPPCPVDVNRDGLVNADDLSDFITCYFGAPPCDQADFNHDAAVDPDDLSDFIAAYFAGCP